MNWTVVCPSPRPRQEPGVAAPADGGQVSAIPPRPRAGASLAEVAR